MTRNDDWKWTEKVNEPDTPLTGIIYVSKADFSGHWGNASGKWQTHDRMVSI